MFRWGVWYSIILDLDIVDIYVYPLVITPIQKLSMLYIILILMHVFASNSFSSRVYDGYCHSHFKILSFHIQFYVVSKRYEWCCWMLIELSLFDENLNTLHKLKVWWKAWRHYNHMKNTILHTYLSHLFHIGSSHLFIILISVACFKWFFTLVN